MRDNSQSVTHSLRQKTVRTRHSKTEDNSQSVKQKTDSENNRQTDREKQSER